MAEHGLSEIQLRHIDAMIRDGVQTMGQERIRSAVEAANQQVSDKTRSLLTQLDNSYASKNVELEARRWPSRTNSRRFSKSCSKPRRDTGRLSGSSA